MQRCYALFTRLGTAALITSVLLGAGPVAQPRPAYAASMLVTTPLDETVTNGQCSLREAITNANDNVATFADCPAGSTFAPDTISFANDGYYMTFSSAFPTIVSNGPGGVIISGVGRAVVLSGGAKLRPFVIAAGASLEMRNVTVTQGVTLTGQGGAFLNDGALTIVDSTVSHSSASGGGGAVAGSGSLIIRGSSFRANSSGGNGGAINGSATISNSSFTDNRAQRGGAIAAQGGAIYNSTITDNVAVNLGGGLAVPNSIFPGGMLFNTVIAGNTASTGPDCFGSFTAGPANLVQDQTECTFTGSASLATGGRSSAGAAREQRRTHQDPRAAARQPGHRRRRRGHLLGGAG